MYFIRTAGDGDIGPVRSLLEATFHDTYDTVFGVDKVREMIESWHSPAALKARVHQKGGEFLVADSGKRIGGMAFAAMSQKLTKTAMLYQLYVHPDCQRQGIGRDLFAEIESCFPDAEIMRLEVEPSNKTAIAFYEAHGFVEVDRTRDVGGATAGFEVIVMEKPLQ